MEAIKPFPPKRDFSSLSVRDLLEARDAYHVHLAHLANVIATAIGRYRIRLGDWYEEHPPNVRQPEGYKSPTFARTLENSRVRPWSWPCVLVFVNDWIDREQFGSSSARQQKPGAKFKTFEPDQMVPRALYLPDGRVIPSCVVQVTQQDAPLSRAQKLSFPRSLIGGGYLLASDVQGREHLGSVGALVSDGNQIYALTNRHVTGEAGREIFSVFGETKVRVGVSDKNQIGKKPFAQAYDGWPGAHVLSNLDAGLVRVDDLSQWTTQVVGLGSVDRPADLTTDTITLDLIGCPVCAFGGASGPLLGQIDALFYRYKSIGGVDYVADLLIGSRVDKKVSEQPSQKTAPVFPGGGSPGTLPGDSGTLWCLEQPPADEAPTSATRRQKPRKPTLRPIALQWGGHVVVEEGVAKSTAHSYALATCLSTICRELDVDLVRDWNSGLPEYWGDVGHYTIAALACFQVAAPGLKTLMTNNLDRVSYEEANIHPSTFQGLSKQAFVPLADVPDKIWKMFGNGRRGNPEHPNHFADMDSKDSKGRTLLQICGGGVAGGAGKIDPAKVKVDVWRKYYDDVKDRSRGCLPFRVWQIYGAMVDALKAGNAARFVCAAGVLAHYVGDACQPLHISHMYDGDPADTVTGTDRNGNEIQVPRARGVHSAYETKMLNSHVVALIQRLNKRLESGALQKPKAVTSGHAAAVAVVELMDQTFHDLKPAAIIKAFNADADLWVKFGDKTVDLMAQGALTLAMLWESAWKQGHGKTKIPSADLGPVDEKELAKLYLDPDFVPSKTLDQIGDFLK